MTITGSGARLSSFCETLASSRPAIRPSPRRPTTIASSSFSCAMSMIVDGIVSSIDPVKKLRAFEPALCALFFVSSTYPLALGVRCATRF